jgi:uncharacterized protein
MSRSRAASARWGRAATRPLGRRTREAHVDGRAISDLANLTADQQRQIRDQILIESSKPLTVAIMGQTGVGKSSLLNALFGTTLNVGDIRPCTRIPEPVTVTGTTGHQLVFWDMPGIGESAASDQHYLQMYRQKIIECDIVLWAIHADTRSTLFDASALSTILSSAQENERNVLIAKLSFVLTKADLLTPPPWIYLRDDAAGTFVPSRALVERMAEKASYYQEILIKPHGILSTTTTHMSDDFSIDDPRFEYDDYRVTYQGFMSEDVRAQYTRAYPAFSGVFDRLCDNQRVIPCSSLFRYNLLPLLITIVNRLGESAIGRFQRLVDGSAVSTTVPVAAMADYCNLVIWDKRQSQRVFDLHDLVSAPKEIQGS